MASVKKITMREYNGTDYDTLYPKTIAEQVDGIYEKDEILNNSTKALYGLANSAVPNDVLSLLSRFQKGLGNEYVWEKRDSTGIVGYVNSPNSNAYPPAVSDGYTYIPLGKLGSSAKIISGMYSGTGTWGESGASRLTFDRLPDFIWIYATEPKDGGSTISATPGNMNSGNASETYTINPKLLSSVYKVGYSFGIYNGSSGWYLYAKADGNTIYWYAIINGNPSHDASSYQLNQASYNYYYLAFFS